MIGNLGALAHWCVVRGNRNITTSLCGIAAALALSACDQGMAETEPAQDDILADASETEPEPEPTVAPAPADLEAREALTQRLAELAEDFGGSTGIAVVDIANGWTTGYGEDKLLPQQSVSKMWVAITLLDAVDKGRLALDETVTISRNDLTVFHQPIRDRVLREGVVTTDAHDLLERAITQSDNTANDSILRTVGGPEAVRKMLSAKNIEGVRFGPGERPMQSAIAGLEWRQYYALTKPGFFEARDKVPDARRKQAFESYLADPVDGATPRGIATALARLARGELLSDASSRRLIAIMRDTRSGPRRLKAGAPQGWVVAHKTGTGQYWDGRQSGYNDVGLIEAPDGSMYALAIMIGETRKGVPASMEYMQAVSRAIGVYHEAINAAPSEDASDAPETDT